MDVRPFRIQVEQAVLDDLFARLRRTRWTTRGESAAWQAGTSDRYLRDLVDHWLTRYDWRAEEAKLNALPQFTAEVAGARLHFVHVQGRGARRTPLLLLHGWPDSFHRFHKVIPRFANPDEEGEEPGELAGESFDVVVPSLPGFAFTGAVPRVNRDQSARASANLIWRLMTVILGYQRFAVAGGDGGSVLAQILAIEHPESVIGIHLTDLGWHAFNVDPAKVSKAEHKYLDGLNKARMADGAYALVQMTGPRSLAAGLNDSPVGLASWIVDRFHSWVDGPLDQLIGKDDLLTNIMLYWVTQTIGASIFNYYTEARAPSLTAADRVEVPVGLALFPKDLGGIPPRRFAERTLNVRQWTAMPQGGHFAALEQPELYADDVIDFFQSLNAPQGRAEPQPVDPLAIPHVAPAF
ncbi:MAG TPA: epoxide hydrolase [Polyangia bacterium]|jgi:microsomal epoxide hydrolase|nr:epoxide hydrolase [Polyangia bacterium]